MYKINFRKILCNEEKDFCFLKKYLFYLMCISAYLNACYVNHVGDQILIFLIKLQIQSYFLSY